LPFPALELTQQFELPLPPIISGVPYPAGQRLKPSALALGKIVSLDALVDHPLAKAKSALHMFFRDPSMPLPFGESL
jgi:hypothetical protein